MSTWSARPLSGRLPEGAVAVLIVAEMIAWLSVAALEAYEPRRR